MQRKSKSTISKLLVLMMFFTTVFSNIDGTKAFASDTASTRLIDVWDFGGVQTTGSLYNNNITTSTLDGLTTVTPVATSIGGKNYSKGSTTGGTTVFGDLAIANPDMSDRLYYSDGTTAGTVVGARSYGIYGKNTYTDGYISNGCYYCNGTAGTGRRYLTINNVVQGDKITIYGATNNGNETIHFVHLASLTAATGTAVSLTADAADVQDSAAAFNTVQSNTVVPKVDFIAKYSGAYQIYVTASASGKPYFNRVVRTPGVAVSGTVNLNGNTLSEGYSINLTNQTTGDTAVVKVNTDNTFNTVLAPGYSYTSTLKDINAYAISDDTKVVSPTISDIQAGISNLSFKVVTNKVAAISGNIKGFENGYDVSKLKITLNPPTGSLASVVTATINSNAMTYSAVVQTGIEYTAVISGVNDYDISTGSTVNINNDTCQDISVAKKTLYTIAGNFLGLSATAKITGITFTNVDDSYTYTGTAVNGTYTANLRNGSYSVKAVCTENYTTSGHVTINGQSAAKDILFDKISGWNLVNVSSSDITNGTYQGLTLQKGAGSFFVNGNALGAQPGSSIVIPVSAGQVVTVSGWYSGTICFNNDTTNQLVIPSTSTAAAPAKLSYTASAAGTVTLNITGATAAYLTAINSVQTVPWVSDLYVGDNSKANNYTTVKDALVAASGMNPTSEAQRITIHIAPGTYRAQLKITTPYISLVNTDPSKQVKITWYYGFGYNYYSVGADSFYNADNAFDKYSKGNVSNGVWGGSVYLTSTATAFRAENIMFENSFNKYVTQEELDDGISICRNFPQSVSGSLLERTSTSQDVASKVQTERAAAMIIEANNVEFNNCSFIGSQDTLYTASLGTNGNYYRNCFIEGNTDYIFGDGNSIFDNCTLNFCGYSDSASAGYITAAKDTATYGYLFRNCTVTANNNNKQTAGFFGRPWGPKAKVTFQNTKLQSSSIIDPAGWTSMSGATPQNANFAEYNTTYNAAAVDVSKRVVAPLGSASSIASVDSYFGSWTPKYYSALPTIISITTPAAITITKGNAATLPTSVTATCSDGSTTSAAITWSGNVDINKVGQQIITGIVEGYSDTVTITVNVTSAVITSITAPDAITVTKGNAVTLPTSVAAKYSDGSTSLTSVTWNGTVDINTVGQQVITGTVAGYSGTVSITVNITAEIMPAEKSYTVATSFNLSNLQPGKVLDIQTTITNNNSKIGAVLTIMALYDENDKIVDVAYTSNEIEIGKAEALEVGFKLPANVANYKVKVFITDGTDITSSSMKPLSNIVTFQ